MRPGEVEYIVYVKVRAISAEEAMNRVRTAINPEGARGWVAVEDAEPEPMTAERAFREHYPHGVVRHPDSE